MCNFAGQTHQRQLAARAAAAISYQLFRLSMPPPSVCSAGALAGMRETQAATHFAKLECELLKKYNSVSANMATAAVGTGGTSQPNESQGLEEVAAVQEALLMHPEAAAQSSAILAERCAYASQRGGGHAASNVTSQCKKQIINLPVLHVKLSAVWLLGSVRHTFMLFVTCFARMACWYVLSNILQGLCAESCHRLKDASDLVAAVLSKLNSADPIAVCWPSLSAEGVNQHLRWVQLCVMLIKAAIKQVRTNTCNPPMKCEANLCACHTICNPYISLHSNFLLIYLCLHVLGDETPCVYTGPHSECHDSC